MLCKGTTAVHIIGIVVYKHWRRKETTHQETSLRRADYAQREDNTMIKADNSSVGTDLHIITKLDKSIS